MTTDFKTQAEAHNAKARAAAQAAQDSFERSDTDGALTQWGHSKMSDLESARARLAENGGKSVFPALFDLEGNLVPAKLVRTQYGQSWALLADADDASSEFVGFFSPSKAQDEARERKNNAKKGYYIGTVRVGAYAHHWAPESARGISGIHAVQTIVSREDKGWDKNAEVVDNGQ